jgi:DNA repair exonuclease SbcCD ATPase subunit
MCAFANDSKSALTQDVNGSQGNLKRIKEELQKSKRDLLSTKQQAHQQKQAGERQIERLRNRFSEESIKNLRTKVPEVFIAGTKGIPLTASFPPRRTDSSSLSLERKQLEELEGKRREMLESNAALKRLAAESLNLAREAAHYMETVASISQEGMGKGSLLGSSSHSSSTSTIPALQTTVPSLFYQRDLFPTLFSLSSDYPVAPVRGQKQHPAVEALHGMSELIHQQGSKLLQSHSPFADGRLGRHSDDNVETDVALLQKLTEKEEDGERDRLLNRALHKVEELEGEIKNRERELAAMHSRREDREERVKQTAEVEKQRQRYLSLCRDLEKQEELLRQEREGLERDREQVLKAELSISMSIQGDEEDSLPSLYESHLVSAPVKRIRDDEKENEIANDGFVPAKRIRTVQEKVTTPREDTMRFVTMRKRRGRLQ